MLLFLLAQPLLQLQLFDFDMEVLPILEVLVGKTIEQALMEVMEEEELDTLRDHQVLSPSRFLLLFCFRACYHGIMFTIAPVLEFCVG
jgi:hypothetical protein